MTKSSSDNSTGQPFPTPLPTTICHHFRHHHHRENHHDLFYSAAVVGEPLVIVSNPSLHCSCLFFFWAFGILGRLLSAQPSWLGQPRVQQIWAFGPPWLGRPSLSRFFFMKNKKNAFKKHKKYIVFLHTVRFQIFSHHIFRKKICCIFLIF